MDFCWENDGYNELLSAVGCSNNAFVCLLCNSIFLINGKQRGNMIPGWGLRQRDPLSSYLFLVCVEDFSSLLRYEEMIGNIECFQVASGSLSVSHLLFVDNSLLFYKTTSTTCHALHHVFHMYGQASCQVINFQKSIMSFSPNTHRTIGYFFTRFLGCQ